MEKLSLQKQSLETEVKNLKEHANHDKTAVSIDDFETFRLAVQDLLENDADPQMKTSIIQKVVQKIVIKNEEIEIYFFVGEKHYKRELELSSLRPFKHELNQIGAKPEKRHSSALPVFHGNPKTSEFLYLKPNLTDLTPNFFYDAGSNSLKNGSERRTWTADLRIMIPLL